MWECSGHILSGKDKNMNPSNPNHCGISCFPLITSFVMDTASSPEQSLQQTKSPRQSCAWVPQNEGSTYPWKALRGTTGYSPLQSPRYPFGNPVVSPKSQWAPLEDGSEHCWCSNLLQSSVSCRQDPEAGMGDQSLGPVPRHCHTDPWFLRLISVLLCTGTTAKPLLLPCIINKHSSSLSQPPRAKCVSYFQENKKGGFNEGS